MDQSNQEQIEKQIQDGFLALPESVQNAITDASVEKKLRDLAEKHKLMLDKWIVLENAIMFTLIGLSRPEDMAKNIASDLGINEKDAQAIVNDIARDVFTPIRELLQKELEAGGGTKRESRDTSFAQEAKNAVKVGPSDSTTYKPGEASTERRDVIGDPYRESI